MKTIRKARLTPAPRCCAPRWRAWPRRHWPPPSARPRRHWNPPAMPSSRPRRRRAARRAHRDAHDLPGRRPGQDSYEVANGSVATYWYGHAFELNGTRYFTGFTWDTRERYGKPGEDDAGPDTQVNLAEATYTLTGSTPDKPWQFRGMTNTIGNFGAYEKPEFVDPKRKPVEYRTPAGQLVLACPPTASTTAPASPATRCSSSTPDRVTSSRTRSGPTWAASTPAATTARPAPTATSCPASAARAN